MHCALSNDSLVGIVHFAAEDGAEDHLDVLDEAVMVEVVAVNAYVNSSDVQIKKSKTELEPAR